MAIIQDLPTEILTRILELSVEYKNTLQPRGESTYGLARTALVAPCWRAPSQSLLSSLLKMDTAGWKWSRYIQTLAQSKSLRLQRVKRLGFSGTNYSALSRFALLATNKVKVEELHVYTSPLLVGGAHLPLLQGLRILALATPITLEGDSQDVGTMALEVLRLHSSLPRLPSLLQPLLTIAPRLTRLDLQWVSTRSGAPFDVTPLRSVAPQLQQLDIAVTSLPNQRHDSLSCFEPFFRACTSLTALSVEGCCAVELYSTLSLLEHPLILLDVIGLRLEEHEHQLPKELVDAFTFPCMAQLRRWRMTKNFLFKGYEEALSGTMGEEWHAACRARGVEPRDDRRYFTD